MPTKPLDRLMFAQGGLCFFCRKPLPQADASVEHLLASANGGSNSDENCVACCKAVNALFGSMSLKEKLQVVLNQNGQFRCPNGTTPPRPKAESKKAAKVAASPSTEQTKILASVIANLKGRGNSRPATLKTLKSTVKTLLPAGTSPTDLNWVLQKLQSKGKVTLKGNAVAYDL